MYKNCGDYFSDLGSGQRPLQWLSPSIHKKTRSFYIVRYVALLTVAFFAALREIFEQGWRALLSKGIPFDLYARKAVKVNENKQCYAVTLGSGQRSRWVCFNSSMCEKKGKTRVSPFLPSAVCALGTPHRND